MMNSRLKWIAVLSVLILAVWACRKEEKTEEAKPPTQAEQKAPTQEQAPQGTTPPQGTVQTQEGMKPPVGGEMAMPKGKEVYDKSCASCHAQGVAGAPKTGNKEVWTTLLAKDPETLTKNAIKGIGSMPPKGGNPNLSEEDVRAAVNYMIEQSR